MDVRANIAAAKRIIVKIGSSSLTNSDHRVDVSKVDRLVDAIAARCARGSDVIVVSSGAFGGGMGPMGLHSRPTDLATKQAVSAVGQQHLMQTWATSFRRYGKHVGQDVAHGVGCGGAAPGAECAAHKLIGCCTWAWCPS